MKKIVIAGAGFAGGIIASQLLKYTEAEVIVLDQCDSVEASESGTGLNINPNGMKALRGLDTELEEQLRSVGIDRNTIRAETMSGKHLYTVNLYKEDASDNLADNPGLKVRWADAYRVLRGNIPVQYNQEVVDWEFDLKTQKHSINVINRIDGNKYKISGVDFFIGADGRYSRLREQLSPANTRYIGVSNFRLIIPDTSAGLFDDMEILYNPHPRGLDEAGLSSDFKYCVSSLPRIGIMKMRAVSQNKQMLWLFGNFGVRDDIPDFAQTIEGLEMLFSPQDPPSDKGHYIRNVLATNYTSMHWARMQYTSMYFGDPNQKILLLGDAAHCIVPTMGQGATLAIEDACVASCFLVDDIRKGLLGGGTIKKIIAERAGRRRYVSNVSMDDSFHLMAKGADNNRLLEEQQRQWTDESSGFRSKLRKVWRNAPTVSI